jgi:hypothetical protein
MLPRLSEQPFRALPRGILRKFFRPRSWTVVPQSVSAFLLDKASKGAPLLRRSQHTIPLAATCFDGGEKKKRKGDRPDSVLVRRAQ